MLATENVERMTHTLILSQIHLPETETKSYLEILTWFGCFIIDLLTYWLIDLSAYPGTEGLVAARNFE